MNYVDEDVFKNMDIKLTWFDYSGYPEYSQLSGDFFHDVTILDVLFNCGKESYQFCCEKFQIVSSTIAGHLHGIVSLLFLSVKL